MENKYLKHGELRDKEIASAPRKAAEDYENGEIIEVRNELADITAL